MSKKFFINNLDTNFGQALLQEIVKQPTEDPQHMCTVRVPLDAKPNGIKKILKREKPKLFRKKALDECEVYVYDLNQTQITDIEFGIEMMEKPFEDNKIFILVSDIMVWSDSGRKIKQQKKPDPAEGQEEEGEKAGQSKQEQQPKEAQQEQADEEPKQAEMEQEKPIEYTHFDDEDFASRNPFERYSYIKEIEDRVLGIKKQNLKIFIVCPGMIYGCGEDILYPLFRAAWLQEPSELPYLGEGINTLPMIHLKDLVKFVLKVAENPPEGPPYLLAFDQNANRTQKGLIQSISSGIGSGKIKSVQSSELIDCPDRFLFNIDIKPSKFLVGTVEEPAQFEWTSKEGIGKNISKILEQFCTKHSLRPMKLLFIQNDEEWRANSKIQSIYKVLSEYYRIPVLRIKDILSEAKDGSDEQLSVDLVEQWANITQYMLKNQSRKLDETMKVFYRAIRWRLSQNDCFNRGFILENFPQFKEELEHIFLKLSSKKLRRKKKKQPKPQKQQMQKVEAQKAEGQEDEGAQKAEGEEGQKAQGDGGEKAQGEQEKPEEEEPEQAAEQAEEPEQEGQGPKIETSFPQSIISIKQAGKQSNDQVIQFFTTRKTEELIYDTTGTQDHQIFQSLRNYIQRNGRPNNYLVEEQELLSKHLQFTQNENKKSLDNREEQKKNEQQKKHNIQDARQKLRDEIIDIVRTEGQEEIKKMPFRNYLMQFVVPTLNEGLLEVSNIIPNDPVDLLAEYLYQKSYDF